MFVPHSPSPSHILPTEGDGSQSAICPKLTPDGHSEDAIGRRHMPLHGRVPVWHAAGGEAGAGGAHGGVLPKPHGVGMGQVQPVEYQSHPFDVCTMPSEPVQPSSHSHVLVLHWLMSCVPALFQVT